MTDAKGTGLTFGLVALFLIGGWVDSTSTTIGWGHVIAVWAVVALVWFFWPSKSEADVKQCPACGDEGTMAFVTDERWVVTCHGYFWTLTDEDMQKLADA